MFSIDIKEFKGLQSEERMTKFIKSIQHAESAINSIEFLHWFMAYPFSQLSLSRDSSTSRIDLYNRLMQQVSFKYEVVRRPWYKRFSKVVGWESRGKIYTYGDAYDAMTIKELAGHLAHEAAHACGFSHSFNNNIDRPKSLPYAVGEYVQNYNIGK